MRCILVNDGNLKADTCCTYCRNKIGDSYAREVGSRHVFCNYDCYRRSTQNTAILVAERTAPLSSWTLGS